MRRHAEGILELAVEGSDDAKTCLLGTGGNSPGGLALDIVHGAQQSQIVEVVVDGLVDRRMPEKVDEPRLCGADEFCQFLKSEVGILVRQLFLQSCLDECHQLGIVAQVSMSDQFLVTDHEFLEHLYAATYIVVSIDLLAELQIVAYQIEVGFLQRLYLMLQRLNLRFIFLLIHRTMIMSINSRFCSFRVQR